MARSTGRGVGAGGTMGTGLAAGAARLGIELPSGTREALERSVEELLKWNAAYNLTAVRDRDEILVRHLLDSLSVLPWLDAHFATSGISAPRLLDVGSGGGFPGIPLAILRPGWHWTLLDSNGKKARYLRHLQRTLGLGNVAVEEQRVEAFEAPEPFDLITSRAFASLHDFTSLSEHLLAAGGRWLAMKGKLLPDELQQLPEGIGIVNTTPVVVPGLAEERHLIALARA